MKDNPPSLLIVYNADSGIFNALSDAVHKAIAPETYECSLCAVTYGMVSMRRDWRQFLGSLPITKRFFHRDDFRAAYPQAATDLPAILLSDGTQNLVTLLGRAELIGVDDLARLIRDTKIRLAENGIRLSG